MSISTQRVDELFLGLGEYVIAFQWLESTVRRVDGLIVAPRVLHNTHLLHRELMFGRLVDVVRADAQRFMSRIGNQAHCATALQDLVSLLDECKAIAEERNGIVHATYDGIEAGGDIIALFRLRTPRSKRLEPKQHAAVPSMFEAPLANVIEMALRLGEWAAQLVQWAEVDS